MSLRTTSLIVSFAIVLLMGAGCNPVQQAKDQVNQKIGEAAVAGVIDKASGGKVSADVVNNQMVFKDNKTGDMMAYGEDVKFPDDFPKDMPIYAGAKAVALTISKQADKGTSVTLKIADDVQKVTSWYADQMKGAGFAEDSSMSAGGTEIRSYSKGSVTLSMTVASDSDSKNAGGSVVTLIRTEKAAN